MATTAEELAKWDDDALRDAMMRSNDVDEIRTIADIRIGLAHDRLVQAVSRFQARAPVFLDLTRQLADAIRNARGNVPQLKKLLDSLSALQANLGVAPVQPDAGAPVERTVRHIPEAMVPAVESALADEGLAHTSRVEGEDGTWDIHASDQPAVGPVPPMEDDRNLGSGRLNRDTFFAAVAPLFRGNANAGQRAALGTILDEWERRSLVDLRWLAYLMATPYHEVGPGMKPIRENMKYSATRAMQIPGWARKLGSRENAKRLTDQGPEVFANFIYANILGNGDAASGDGWRYRGGGWVQVTGKDNYAKISQATGINLVANPERIVDLPVATIALFDGMILGLFTGSKLADFFDLQRSDWIGARRIIAGGSMFGADAVADDAQKFYAALQSAFTGH